MAVIIGAKPDSGFDNPIGMLKDCHRRIEGFLGILCLVCGQARGRALTDDERSAAEAALRYFGESGPRHNADEEESVFPRLREGASSVLAEVMQLEADHRDADDLHEQVATFYRRWIAEGRLTAEDHAQLVTCTSKLQLLYREHIRIEEEVVFPRAAELFDLNTVRSVGAEFKARRESTTRNA